MSHRFLASIAAPATAVAILSLAPAPVVGQGRSADADWTLPRTADGRPDLQGIWSNVAAIPFERPRALGRRATLTDEEVAKLADRIAAGRIDRPPAKGSAGNYNKFWSPPGRPSAQSSLIIDPPDGRLPPRTPYGQRRADIRAIPRIERLDTGDYADRDLWERCMSMGVPRLPGGYNNNIQIFQTPDHLAILIEMVHEVRIIPLDPHPHITPRIRQYLGDSRGYWDGDTLVVETTNFAYDAHFFDYRDFRGSTGDLHLVERFTRVDADTLHYEFTVTEPTTFIRPWTAMVPITKTEEPIFEYACHEGNRALANILRGARVQEKVSGERAPR
jgi:hypothetical protein